MFMSASVVKIGGQLEKSMWIVAIGWAYVVILMAATETSVIAGIMTFFGYCVLPLSILFYIAGAGKRRQRRAGASPHANLTSTTTPDGDAGLPFASTGFFLASDGAGAACGSADSGGDCGGGDGGGGGGD